MLIWLTGSLIVPSQELNFIHEWIKVKWQEEEGPSRVFLMPLKWFLISDWCRSGAMGYAGKLADGLLLTNNTNILCSSWGGWCWLRRMSLNLKLCWLPTRDLELENFLLHTEVQMTCLVRVSLRDTNWSHYSELEERKGCVTNWASLQGLWEAKRDIVSTWKPQKWQEVIAFGARGH